MEWLIDIIASKLHEELENKIVLWSGSIANIPDGWQLCDGTNGTPDLRDRFVVAASEDEAGVPVATLVGAAASSGGSAWHTHSFDGDGHGHESKGGYVVDSGSEHDVWDRRDPAEVTQTNLAGGTTEDQADIAVPYYALAYIMRV